MATLDTASLVTAEQRQQFETQGFFMTDVLFDEETLAGVREEFERIWQENIEATQGADDTTRDLARYRPFLPALHEISPACDAFCQHPVFLQLCREFIGADADMTWNQAIIKPPAPINNSFSWHQDMWYALHSSYSDDCDVELLKSPATPSFTVWVAISRTVVDNGTLWVLPGRHKDGLLPHVWNEERNDWEGQYDTSWKIPAVMQAGQMLVFHKYLPHGSGPNILEENRMAYQIGYSIPGVKPASARDIVPVLRDNETTTP